MRFRLPIQNSSRYFSRLKRICRTQTLTSTEHHISSVHSHFWVQRSSGSAFPQPDKNRKFLRFFIIILNLTSRSSFLISVQTRFLRAPRASSALHTQILTKFISIGSYSPEVRAFGTLITSTKVFRLIICKTL